MKKEETELERRERLMSEAKRHEDRMKCPGPFANPYDTSPPLGQHHFELPEHPGGMMSCIRCGFTLGRG